GRRLEDDVTTIELQAVGGVVLAAIGLWYDDYNASDPNASPLSKARGIDAHRTTASKCCRSAFAAPWMPSLAPMTCKRRFFFKSDSATIGSAKSFWIDPLSTDKTK
ncbi:MAG: hypothetical protein EOP06_28795, partial [Proteobacteria bacterium]